MRFTINAVDVVNKEDKIFIEKRQIDRGRQCDLMYQQNCILFVNTGILNLSFSNVFEKEVCAGQMITLSSGRLYNVQALDLSTITLFFISSDTALSKLFSGENFLDKKYIYQDGYSLKYDLRLDQFITYLYEDVQNGIDFSDFLSAKTIELFYLLQARFTKNELCLFFTPIFTSDQTFSTFIWLNYQKVKTIKELASLSCYSVSGFEKRFKRVFGVAASHWIKEQKANDLLREMRSGNKPLKQIMLEYGFFSASHFNNFCKTRLGYTPGRLMKSK